MRKSAWATLMFPPAAAILASCSKTATPTVQGPTVNLTPNPSNPEKYPIFQDDPPIASGLSPESGPLEVYSWADYQAPKALRQFEKENNVKVEVTVFDNLETAFQKMATGGVSYDVFLGSEPRYLPKLVATKLLQPLNLSYIPNLQKNIWPQLVDPWYDRASQYSVPNYVFRTGIGYRTDMVSEDIAKMANPYEIFWNAAYQGKVGLFDNYRAAMPVALLKNGITDINTSDPKNIDLAKTDLETMTSTVNVRFDFNSYNGIPEGDYAIHQATSGDMIGAPYFGPKGFNPDVLRFAWPSPNQGGGIINLDLLSIPKSAKHPVIAHQFLNFLLSPGAAGQNLGFVGYQAPQNSLTPKNMIGPWNAKGGYVDGYVLDTVGEVAIVRPEDLGVGYWELPLSPAVDSLWQQAWAEVKAGVSG